MNLKMSNIDKFIKAQDRMYDIALNEIKSGKKKSHWIWFIFPQIQGLGCSDISCYYSIENLVEAKDYLNNPILGNRLIEISNELLKLDDDINNILGTIDSLKVCSSMTLFSIVNPNIDVFKKVIDKFYEGKYDDMTINILNSKEKRR